MTGLSPARQLSDLVYELADDASNARHAAFDAERQLHRALAQYEEHILPERRTYVEEGEDQLTQLVIIGSREAADAIESNEDTDTAERRVFEATDGNLPNLAAEWVVEKTREKIEEQP